MIHPLHRLPPSHIQDRRGQNLLRHPTIIPLTRINIEHPIGLPPSMPVPVSILCLAIVIIAFFFLFLLNFPGKIRAVPRRCTGSGRQIAKFSVSAERASPYCFDPCGPPHSNCCVSEDCFKVRTCYFCDAELCLIAWSRSKLSFLYESATTTETIGRYSFLGAGTWSFLSRC